LGERKGACAVFPRHTQQRRHTALRPASAATVAGGAYAAAQVLGNQRLASRRPAGRHGRPPDCRTAWRNRRKAKQYNGLGVLDFEEALPGKLLWHTVCKRWVVYAESSASSRPICVPRGPWKREPSGRPAVLSCGAFVRGTRQLAHAGVAACRLMRPEGSRSVPRRAVEIARCSPAARVAKEGEVFVRESVRAQRGGETPPYPPNAFSDFEHIDVLGHPAPCPPARGPALSRRAFLSCLKVCTPASWPRSWPTGDANLLIAAGKQCWRRLVRTREGSSHLGSAPAWGRTVDPARFVSWPADFL